MRTVLVFLALICLPVSVLAADLFESDSKNAQVLELRKALIGTWHTKFMQSDGGYREEYLAIEEDGSFRLRFLSTNRLGRLVDAYAIIGIWGVAENIFFTSNLNYEYRNDVEFAAFLGDADEFNAYKILEINDSYQRYQALGKDGIAKLNKIAADPCKSHRAVPAACGNQDRILDPSESNNGSVISLAE